MTRLAAAALAVWFALAANGCGARQHPVALDAPDDAVATAPRDAPPVVVEEETVTTIEEEALPDESAGDVQSDPNAALSVGPPALEPTIDANTAPNVAAATRLADAGRARMAAGDDGAALEQLERAIAIDPGNVYAYYYLAELHFLHRTYDQAIAFADRAATLGDARAPEWASRAYTLQGNAFEAAGRFPDAREAYTRAIQAAPGNLAAQVGLARVGASAAPQP